MMASDLASVLIVIAAIGVQIAEPYSTGGPNGACDELRPNHGVDRQDSPPPYEIEVLSISSGSELRVTITSTAGEKLAGFMLQARDASNRNKLVDGVFTEDKQTQIKSCNSDKANTLTHRSGDQKSRINSNWSPPSGYSGSVVFRATVVQSKSVFWTEVDSEPVLLEALNSSAVKRDHELLINDFQADSPNAGQSRTSRLDYSVCERGFCYGLGVGSDCVRDQSCECLLSGAFDSPNRSAVEFQISAAISANHYCSMGLSSDPKMGDDSVTDCFVNSRGEPQIGHSFNIDKTNVLATNQSVIRPLLTGLTDGIITCRWLRSVSTLVNGRQFNLRDNRFHILLAVGEIVGDDGRKTYHSNRQPSAEPIDLALTGSVGASKDLSYLIRIHGSLMVIAWTGTVSVAILLARHYKQVWMSRTLCGVKIWFASHRALNLLSVALMFTAQCCIFYYVGEFKIGSHQLFGALAVTIAFLQPIGAWFRPAPDAGNRWIFNWFHWFAGNAGQISAIVAIFLATGLPLADLPKPAFIWTLISFVIFHVFVHIVLQFHAFVMRKRRGYFPTENADIALQEMSDQSADQLGGDVRVGRRGGRDAPGSCFRRFVLGVYVIIVFAFVVALVTLISTPKSTLKKMSIT